MRLRRHRRYVDSPSPRAQPEVTVDAGEGESVAPLDEQQSAAVDGAESENTPREQRTRTVRPGREEEEEEVPSSRRVRRSLSLFTRIVFLFVRLLCKVGIIRR